MSKIVDIDIRKNDNVTTNDFTALVMASALEDATVSYEELAELEKDFEDVENEIREYILLSEASSVLLNSCCTVRQQIKLTAPLYTRRAALVSKIPNFWPLVLEMAPAEIDQFIQPSDSALLLSSLTSIDIDFSTSDPRDFSIKFEFAENDNFEDKIIEKQFWHRRARYGWEGLVSEPVRIRWKKGKDLTGGVLDMVCDAWESEKPQQAWPAEGEERKLSEAEETLQKKMKTISMDGLSFFAWFGYVGRAISAEESEQAMEQEKKRRERFLNGEKESAELPDEPDDTELLEVFVEGSDLAVAFKEDLYPEAMKYFSELSNFASKTNSNMIQLRPKNKMLFRTQASSLKKNRMTKRLKKVDHLSDNVPEHNHYTSFITTYEVSFEVIFEYSAL